MTTSANEKLTSKRGLGGPVPPLQGIFEISATQKADLGFRLRVGDRTFHYGYAGGVALIAGSLLESATLVAEEGKSPSADVAAGATTLTVTTAAAQSTCAEGYMFVHEGAGEGHAYRIKQATANATTATSTDLVLYDPIVVAMTAAASQVAIMNNLYYDLDIHATITKYVVGVAPMAVTANYYFWCQTWGPASVLQSGIDAAGSILVPHTTDGSVTIQTLYTSNIVGVQLYTGTAAEHQPVYLRIAP